MTGGVPKTASATDNPCSVVAHLTSVMRICSLALDSTEDYREDLRKNFAQDVRHVLEHYAEAGMDMFILAEANVKAGREAVQS